MHITGSVFNYVVVTFPSNPSSWNEQVLCICVVLHIKALFRKEFAAKKELSGENGQLCLIEHVEISTMISKSYIYVICRS